MTESDKDRGHHRESTPLMGSLSSSERRKSVFKIGREDESQLLITSQPPDSRTSRHHQRGSSDWTWMSFGNFTNLGSKWQQGAKLRSRFKTTLLIGGCYLLTLFYTCTILIGPLALSFQDKSEWCSLDDERHLKRSDDAATVVDESESLHSWDMSVEEKEYVNPDFNTDPCQYIRLPQLAWLTLDECDFSRRMLTSVILGGAIGYERRTSDRPAGIRTMSLVSLGACFFTISSIMAFKSSTMGWDASRVTAALPSGVGFLGAALIWKGSIGEGDQETHQVHGLTTAASLWLSAAIGVGAGGALYVVSIYSTVLILLVLRFGPRFYMQKDYESEEEEEEESEEEDESFDELDMRGYLGSLHKERSMASLPRETSLQRESSVTGQRRVIITEPNFPQSLTSEDRGPTPTPPPSLLSARSLTDTSVGTAREGRMRRRKSAVLHPPTFHS